MAAIEREGRVSTVATPSPWAFGPRKLMKNRHNDMPCPIRTIPFVFSTSLFFASGFSRSAAFLLIEGWKYALPSHGVFTRRAISEFIRWKCFTFQV